MEMKCPGCGENIVVNLVEGQLPKYCLFCSTNLQTNTPTVTPKLEKPPEKSEILFSIGPYHAIKNIGQGGMGEVFLAYDTRYGRNIALKRIRPDLITQKQLRNRFLREARITSQLTHPAIIPIYSMRSEDGIIYYTMPYVEGQTLKDILSNALKKEKAGLKQDHLSTIPSLVRTFLSVCQAIAYAHSKKVVHRDIKPQNIIVGRFGEVLILDWGLAKLASYKAKITEIGDDELDESPANGHDLTRFGKVVGTLAYLAPERALGMPATYQTDIYSLGVILYQILTLHFPFIRQNLKEFRRQFHKEIFQDPSEVAPYRDVPPILSRITKKCLEPSIEKRYRSVDELIHDIEIYIEGRSEWFLSEKLKIDNKSDWEFQENVLIAEHIAITRAPEISQWVSLMVSKTSFAGNIKLEADVRIGEHGQGIGFLLSIPESAERKYLNSGYCLWIGSDTNKSTKLLRASVEVIDASESFLPRNRNCKIKIEKIENNIHFYINDLLQFSYISHLPLTGTHIGILSSDADFTMEELNVYVGSQNIQVNCLAIPDAFLSHNDYATALNEYRRIAYSFPGTAEGREALFKAGITLLEDATETKSNEQKNSKFDLALEEFLKLRGTAGAPLEYLGKSLVYQAMKQYEEEFKCFELAYRRYPNHPMLPILQEQLVYRMHDSSHSHRTATYEFALLAVLYHQGVATTNINTKRLFQSLKRNWESLYFIEEPKGLSEEMQNRLFAIQLAFWLSKPYILIEMIDGMVKSGNVSSQLIVDAIFALLEMEEGEMAKAKIQELQNVLNDHENKWLSVIINNQEIPHFAATEPNSFEIRSILYLMDKALQDNQPENIHAYASRLKDKSLSSEDTLLLHGKQIWAYLIQKDEKSAGKLLENYPMDYLIRETTPLHFLYGCWLALKGEKETAQQHFASVLEINYPRSWALFSYFYHRTQEENDRWLARAFKWEKKQYYRQFALFYHCNGDAAKTAEYTKLANDN